MSFSITLKEEMEFERGSGNISNTFSQKRLLTSKAPALKKSCGPLGPPRISLIKLNPLIRDESR